MATDPVHQRRAFDRVGEAIFLFSAINEEDGANPQYVRVAKRIGLFLFDCGPLENKQQGKALLLLARARARQVSRDQYLAIVDEMKKRGLD